jgi:hypothetical protein
LRASLHASGADALEPRSNIVGGDEVDDAGGVNEAARPRAPRARPGKSDDDQTDNEGAHLRWTCDVASHL